ncbi:MAG: protein kinase [Verrucomicrobia bacterium]|nr:protein kinase [Verrucomicrobiota bacterium]
MISEGATIGDFAVETQLGRGGFKTVFRARNTQPAANGYPEIVALCVPHAQDEESRKLLHNEARIAQSLDHPAVVRFYGVEESDGMLFAITELVEGETLLQALRGRGALPLVEAVEIVRQIASALDCLHASLRFHRDIKPSNIMLERADEQDGAIRARLLDFGLSRLMAHSQYLATSRVGSVCYMAPEQFGGSAGMNADVWALGVTFYQSITNALPFAALDEASLMHHILYEPPDVNALEGGTFDQRLVGVIRRVLEKDPEKRYRKAGDFASDLEAVLCHAGAVSPLEGAIEVLLRSHFPLIFIESYEEERVLASLERIREVMAAGQPSELYVWSETRGLTDRQGRIVPQTAGDPLAALQKVISSQEGGVFVFLDMHRHFTPVSVRLIRDAVWTVKRQRKSLVFVSPVLNLPAELEADVTLLSFPPPDMERLRDVVGGVNGEADGGAAELDAALRESLARAVIGLTEREAGRVMRRAALLHGGLGWDCVAEVVRQKQQVVRKSGVLEFVEPDVSFDNVGGLTNLKAWFRSRRRAFSPEGMRFGLRLPRGAVLVGVPGCGKSLSAKALAADWQVPLLRLDMGRLRGSLVGESERRLRQALSTADLTAPCVLWIDELEKAFSGLGSAHDGGVSQRMFGMFLNWLSEKRTPVFTVATANNVQQLPAEFTRKGRFDEVFFVGLPDEEERRAIWKIHLQRPRSVDAALDSEQMVELSDGYTGAEIAEAVVAGMYQAFTEDARPVCAEDLAQALRETIPMSTSHRDAISDMEAWGRSYAVSAS